MSDLEDEENDAVTVVESINVNKREGSEDAEERAVEARETAEKAETAQKEKVKDALSHVTVVVNDAKNSGDEDKAKPKEPSKFDLAMADVMLHGDEGGDGGDGGGAGVQAAGGELPEEEDQSVFGAMEPPQTFVFAPSMRAPSTLGSSPTEIASAATQTSVLHRRGPCSVRDEYALAGGNGGNSMWRAVTWVDQERRDGVQYLLHYDMGTAKVRVAKFFASASVPKPAPQYERTDDVLDVQRKFGPPGAAAVCLFAARDKMMVPGGNRASKGKRLTPQHQFAMPLLVRGPDNGWWNVMMPVIVTHAGGVRDLLRAWGGASCMEDAADIAAHLPKPARLSIVPPKRIGQQPASISRCASSTTVAHRRDGKSVKDDYAKVDARTVVRSITWNAGSESVQYIVRLDLVEATTHVAKFYVSPEPKGGVLLDWEEEMPLAEAHDRFGAPGAAASVLFGDVSAQEDERNTALQMGGGRGGGGGGGPTAVPSCAAQIGKTRVPMAFAVSKRNIVPSGAGLIKA